MYICIHTHPLLSYIICIRESLIARTCFAKALGRVPHVKALRHFIKFLGRVEGEDETTRRILPSRTFAFSANLWSK